MKNHKMYEADDKMISLISDKLQSATSFGQFWNKFWALAIKLYVRFAIVKMLTLTHFLAIVNFTMNGYKEYDDADRLSIPTLVQYLKSLSYLLLRLPIAVYS